MFRKRHRDPYWGAGGGPRDWAAAQPWDEDNRPNSPLALVGVLGVIFLIVAAVIFVPALLSGDTDKGTVAYAGDDTTIVAPSPKYDSATKLEDNPLLAVDVSLASVTCELPELGRSKHELRAFYQAAIDCLNDAWRPALFDAGYGWVSPKLSLKAQPGRCESVPDKDEATAFYCSGTIFMPRTRILHDVEMFTAGHLLLLAHEYGHHVQWQSEILRARAVRKEALSGSDAKQLEISRRAELQAACFAGLFIASMSDGAAMAQELLESLRFASSETHGSHANRKAWVRNGIEGNGPAACNTWTVPAEKVA